MRGLHFGRYGNTSALENRGFQPLYLGFETFIRGYAFDTFESGECSSVGPTEPNPVSTCAEFNRHRQEAER